MSAAGWNMGATVIVFLGGLAVLVGSVAQARGDLRKYQDLLKTTVDGAAQAHANEGLGDFLSKDDDDFDWIGRAKQVLQLPRVVISTSELVSGADPGRARQALNDAAGWSLILFGSLLAVAASVIQFCLLVFR